MAGSGYMVGKGFTVPAALANPTSAPASFTNAATGGTMGASTYFVKYTWLNATGETIPCTQELSTTTTGTTSTITVTVPSFPMGVTSANIYVGTAAGAESLQGNISSSGGSLTISSPLVAGKPLPIYNSTSFQDINPSILSLAAGSEFDIHNVYYNAPYAIGTWDGTTSVLFDSDTGTGARMGVLYHCNGIQWVRVYNQSSYNTLQVSFDGVQTE